MVLGLVVGAVIMLFGMVLGLLVGAALVIGSQDRNRTSSDIDLS